MIDCLFTKILILSETFLQVRMSDAEMDMEVHVCEICEEILMGDSDLAAHMQEEHGNNKKEEKVRTKFVS